MSFGVVCTFDLKGASSGDYQNAYVALERLGLYKAQDNSSGGKTAIPTTTVLGSYTGASASVVRDDVRAKVKAAFESLRFKSEILIVVWGAGLDLGINHFVAQPNYACMDSPVK